MASPRSLLDRFAGGVIAWRVPIVAGTLLLFIPAAWDAAAHFESENSLEIWFDESDPEMRGYRQFQERFGSEEFFVVAFDATDVFSEETLALVADLTKELGALSAGSRPVRVLSLANVAGEFRPLAAAGLGGLPFDPDRILEDPREREAFARWALANPAVAGVLVSHDRKTVLLLGRVPRLSIDGKRALEEDVLAVLARHEGSARFHLGGTPILDAEFDRHTRRDTWIFLPVAFGAIVLVLAGVFRRPGPVVLCSFAVAASLAFTLTIFHLAGNRFNIATSLLPPLLLAISIADGVHIVVQYQEALALGLPKREAIRQTLLALFRPCFFTSLTTALGFGSFLLMDVRPIQVVGLYTAIGVSIAFVVSFTFLPAALLLFPPPVGRAVGEAFLARARFALSGWLDALARACARWRGLVLASTLPLAAFSVWGIARIDVQTYGVEFFREDEPIRQAYEMIESRMGGITTFEFVVEGEAGDFHNEERIADLAAFEREYERGPVTDVFSAASLLAIVEQARRGWDAAPVSPSSSGASGGLTAPLPAGPTLALLTLAPDSPARSYITPDGSAARVSVRLLAVGTGDAVELMDEMEAFLARRFPEGRFAIEVTGIVPMYVRLDQLLTRSQIVSFGFASLVIFASMALLVRSVRIGLLSIPPNILPIAVTLGLMGFAGVPLDVATVMVAGAAIGIVVDDTIHYLTRFRRELAADGDYVASMRRCHRTVGRAMVFTSVILVAGFGTLAFGSFNPTVALGALTALTMVLALVGDLVLLPVLLLVFRPYGGREIESRHRGQVLQAPREGIQ